ncbi:GNAT family N-acetyltransferase [Paenibacillus montanisoli]|uniref:GNAT family N-acetyltransferase n=1 Tax=Paenibacillus montanisoli TaxID=2081970 RepID=A0A328U0D8_9BACL|nr:GNAT family N-acetyltransferase [Paenibacillus montanisoli]RAP73434.1 GNAT family N-acetyltransferase [Paenibacillus montanisoli]
MRPNEVEPILLQIPESLETNRLIIRAPQWDDGQLVNEAVKQSIDELRPWMPWAQQLPTLEESEVITRQGRVHFMKRSDLMLYLIHKRSGAFIGSSGLHRIDWAARKFEIGYWINTPYAGQGYITEAVEGITRFAIDSLQANRIEIRCDARNVRSARVAERLGFAKEGILRSEKPDVSGSLRDTVIYAKVRGHEF